jgi:hypothetical protein
VEEVDKEVMEEAEEHLVEEEDKVKDSVQIEATQNRNKYQPIKTKTLRDYTFDIGGAERANEYINNVNYIVNYIKKEYDD